MSDEVQQQEQEPDCSSSSTYVHREGTREYLESEVLPHVHAALAALLHKMQEERLQLAAGVGLDEGRFRPKGWRPFCAHEWLANYLLEHKPDSLQNQADAGAASGSAAAELGSSGTVPS